MDLDPEAHHESNANWELRALAADVIQTWFRDLEAVAGAVERYRPGTRRWRITLPDHEFLGSASAAMAYLSRGREWFGHAGRFGGWSSVLRLEDDACAEIVARFDREAERLIQRLRALDEAGR